MRRSALGDVFARRLNLEPGRVERIGQRAAEAGLLPVTEGSRRYPPELSTAEAVTFLLAVLTDDGLGKVPQQVSTFSALTDGSTTLHAALADLFSHGPALAGAVHGDLIIRLDPATASLTAGGHFRRFGPEPPAGAAGRHVVVPGRALAAIGLEFQGRTPAEADELVALARISASPSVGHAFSNPGFK
ncbi:hypothetical protein NO932_08670 [Pelagibacterium sp. 26DY04]|uniref:hypothetical protein n=1 Tax=Pelagibacterium sp. 26DY04 TaxID=2967130 RepID=UPI002814C3B5|nr:hypothetical protein [Pelagibacterium sp. 26DY04]WMT88662.1 hypothetical protein NO932_08670 [Pelagibacterium sp. 26DY04]